MPVIQYPPAFGTVIPRTPLIPAGTTLSLLSTAISLAPVAGYILLGTTGKFAYQVLLTVT